ncbi:MAG: DUF559 domain-containing protein [Solirubrobacteraceae bacterium]
MALAESQHGVVARWQLVQEGLQSWAVDKEIARRHLLPIHRGVFAVGHRRLSHNGHWMGAVLACGPDAVLSHHAAAALHDLRPRPQGKTDVSAPGKRQHTGVRCHVSSVPQPQRTEIDRIPVTSLERTYLDYAEQATPRQLDAALEAARRRDLLDLRKLNDLVNRSHGRRGVKPLRQALAKLTDDPPWTQSPLEEAFLALIHRTNLPRPRANVLVHGELVDFAWPRQKLIVELDGFAFHASRARFESDRKRDIELQKRGWRVLRITHRRLIEDPARVIADVTHLLNQ